MAIAKDLMRVELIRVEVFETGVLVGPYQSALRVDQHQQWFGLVASNPECFVERAKPGHPDHVC